MSKKTDKIDLDFDTDDFNFDDSMSGFSGAQEPKGRAPVRKLIGGLKSGIGKQLADEDEQRAFIKKALPDGYDTTYDAVRTGSKAVAGMYRDATREFDSVNTAAKDAARKILPRIKQYLPHKIHAKVANYAGAGRSHQNRDYEEDELQQQLMEMFGAPGGNDAQAKKAALTPVKDAKDILSLTDNMVATRQRLDLNTGINRLVRFAQKRDDYDTTVGAKLARKQIELSYRQLFAQQKMVDVLKQTLELNQASYKDIIQNTSLPDMLKSHKSEELHDIMKKNFYGKVAAPISKTLQGAAFAIAGKVRDKVKGTARDLATNISFGSDMLEMMLEMQALEAEMASLNGAPMEPEKSARMQFLEMALENGGAMVGGHFTRKASIKLASWAKKRFGDNEKLKKYGLVGKNLSNNATGYLQDFLKNHMHGGGVIAGLSNFFNLGDLAGHPQSNLLQRSRDDLTKQSFFTNKTDIAITKVMPGLLAKIHQELRIIRTGDASHEAISFSHENDQFEEAHVRRKRVYDRVYDQSAITDFAEKGGKVLETIDPKKELSSAARKQLSEHIHSVGNDESSMVDLRKLVGYDSPLKGKVKDEVTDFLEKNYGITDMDTAHAFNGSSNSKLMDRFNRLTDGPTFNNIRADAKGSMVYQQMRDKMTAAMRDMQGSKPNDFGKALDITKEEDMEILRQLGIGKQGAGYGDWEYDPKEIQRLAKGGKRRTNFGGPGGGGLGGAGNMFGGGPTPNLGGNNGGSGGGGPGSGSMPRNPFRYHSFASTGGVGQGAGTSANTDSQKVVDKLDELKKAFEAKNATDANGEPKEFSMQDAWEEWKTMQSGRDEIAKANWERLLSTQESALQMLLTQGAAGGGVDETLLRSAVSGGIIKKNGWIKKSWGAVKTLGGSTWSGMSGMLKFGGRVSGGLVGAGFGLAGSVIGGGIGLIGNTARALGSVSGTMKKAGGGGFLQGKLGDQPVDLYVKGEDTPRLLASKMAKGEYLECMKIASKDHVINKPSDIIEGFIRDTTTDTVILTHEDFKKGLYTKDKTSLGGKLVAGGIKLSGKILGMLGSVAAAPFKAMGMMGSAVKWLAKGLFGAMTYMNDIYVVGEASPRLIATLLNNGGYVCNGKPIMKLKDIVGEVQTVDGQVVLTHSDIQKGLVWKSGKPVVLMKDRIMAFAKKAAMLPLRAAGAALGLGFKLLKLPFKALKLGFKGIGAIGRGLGKLFPSNWGKLSGADRKVAASEMQVQLLEAILKTLQQQGVGVKDYQDDGAGMRTGSAMERWKKAIADRLNGGKKADAMGPPAPVNHKSDLGMLLLTAVTGAVAEVKHLKTEAVTWLKRIALARSINAAAGGLGGGGLAGGAVGRAEQAAAGRAGRFARLGQFASRIGPAGKLLGGAALMYGANRMMSGGDDDGSAHVDANGHPVHEGMWDKYGKPLAGFAASTAAWHYGMKGAGKLFSSAGRGELMQGGRSALSHLGMMKNGAQAIGRAGLNQVGKMGLRDLAMGAGRQALMAGARTALIDTAIGLGALISAPVLIGIAAVAVVGALAYGIYRWKHRKVDVIQNFRMNQYGYDEGDDNHCTQILTFEKMLIKNVKMNGKTAVLGTGVSVKNMMDIFKVKEGDKAAMLKLTTWFQYRFKPVFLGHVTSFFGIMKNTNIFDADTKLNRDQRKQMLNDVNISGSGSSSPYSYKSSPFNGEEEVKLDYNEISKRFASYMNLIEKLDDPTSKGKSKWAKFIADPMKKLYASAKSEAKKDWAATKKAGGEVWNSTKSWSKDVFGGVAKTVSGWGDKMASYVPESVKNVGRSIAEGAKTAYNGAVDGVSKGIEGLAKDVSTVGQRINGAGHSIATAYRKLTGSIKDRQMQVFQSFINAGFSKNQAMALTAEVGRENDYGGSMYGTHTDASSTTGTTITNLGYISWNGPRKAKLQAEAKAAGLLNEDGTLKEGQASLDLQAKFVMEEMRGPYARSMKGFIDKPDVDPEAAAAQVGKKYIGWAYGQDTLRSGLHFDWHGADNKRRNYLKNIQDAIGKTNIATKPAAAAGATPAAIAAGTPKGAGTVPVSAPANAAALAAGSVAAKANTASVAANLPSAATPGLQAPSSTSVNSSTTPVSGLAAGATVAGTPPCDPALVALGKKAIKLSGDVNLNGMNQQFMNMFYAMVGEYWKSTGRSVQINSAFRSPDKQKAMYAAYLARGKTKPLVAVPGRSRHEKGLAIDINSAEANDMDSSGLMRKYKFHRPLLKHPSCPEPWHVENLCFGSGAAADATVKAIITDGKKPVTPGDLKKVAPDQNKPVPGGNPVGQKSIGAASTVASAVAAASPKSNAPIGGGEGSEAAARNPVAAPGSMTSSQTQQIASARMPSMGSGTDAQSQVAAIAQRERKAKTDTDMDQLRTTSADSMVKEQKLTNMKLDQIIQIATAMAKGQVSGAKAAQAQAANANPTPGAAQANPLSGQSAQSMRNPFANPPIDFRA